LLQAELHAELRALGVHIGVGDLGENITTAGIDLLTLPTKTRLHFGATAVVELTGLRKPCVLIDRFMPGLMAGTFGTRPDGTRFAKAGVMSVVLRSGQVQLGDAIEVELPSGSGQPLAYV
jgi:MOSC domain-containing protein YiiM